MVITINGKLKQIDTDPNMPLLWVIRDILGMTGTKFVVVWHNAALVRCT
ncbi:aerobic-type carbon monoxide dehydrogenase small subunit (CoxS/CutS family) [Mucilaginibacter lappiensis]|uniref:Aerobic-type carbon monoxide dehydrogenase small subunit (CoxS/CutS family) n=1 Tax=Mucilaginibacter lappiensis TaxID=354630 RepID=A0A841JPX8_9SPHI|nr:aerobic-type carbon monoxide dehydrogenase small subunit (CoxS/CutS family) [Mucilaginibacter lappiensis]